MVAASKMKRAQKRAVEGKPYSEKIFEITTSLIEKADPKLHRLLRVPKKDSRPLMILVSTNRGLCGSLNLNLFRKLADFIAGKQKKRMRTYDYVVLGKKGLSFVVELGGGFLADFSDILPLSEAIGPLTETVSQRFTRNKNTSVWLAYNNFLNALKQEPTIRRILPLTGLRIRPQEEKALKIKVEYLIEPSPNEVLEVLLPFYLESQLREAIFQAEASEYSARMVAMKNATNNAVELMADLTLGYNKARQQAITLEIADIVTSKISMEKKREI